MVSENVLINTGNVFAIDELKLKAGRTSDKELIDALQIVIKDPQKNTTGENDISAGGDDRKELMFTVKIFMPEADPNVLRDALNQILKVLHTEFIETVILAYGDFSDSGLRDRKKELQSLQQLWSVMEEFFNAGKVLSGGVSNVDTTVFMQLYEWANVKPTIVQINLLMCCVVPPTLQAFTQEHDIQLLTHNDPNQLLNRNSVIDIFGANADLKWVAKYQKIIKCRGVITSMGYLVNISK
ncbi:glutamate--cysteine ligase regulatory subunit [Chelonus insularis]|uniref:glutamate--cysteine ligase regulatory subunit n=1 Tax=Chelonus insularis TaxID=460826 RepID=UPI0015891F59|nr:glutamate--cysteine ligase regulatory subunit [Chelonus insularis]